MKIQNFLDFVSEGIRKVGDNYVFDWMTNLPEDLMSLKFSKYSGRIQKVKDSDTTYTYFYAYHLAKTKGSSQSTDLMKAIKLLDKSISPDDIKMLINKAVIGLDSTLGSSNYNAIVSPESSSLILKELVHQLSAKSGVAELFADSSIY